MNETVIQEIANQLGMAVDQAGVFIQTYLPQYAMLKTVHIGVPMLVFGIVLVVATVVVYRCFKSYKAYCAERSNVERCTFIDYVDNNEFMFIPLSVYAGFLIVYICALATFVPEMIGWMVFPEAQLINDCMDVIKQ